MIYYGEELLDICPTPKLEDNHFSGIHNTLLKIIASPFHIWRLSSTCAT
jgi:hypothetical protein